MPNDNTNDPFAPPRAHVEDVTQAREGPQNATRVQRLLAAMVDGLLAFALAFVAMRFFPIVATQPPGWTPQLGAAAVGLACFLLLQGYPLATRQQTLGKMLFNIRITLPDGSPANLQRLAVRYGLGMVAGLVPYIGMVYGLVDALFIFGKPCRCLHDYVAGTVVLKV